MTDIDKYIEHPGMNQSSLSLLIISPKAFKAKEKREEKKYFNVGTAADTWLCFGEEYFNEKFFVTKHAAPTAMLLQFAQHKINGKTDQEAYDMTGYKPTTIKLSKVLENLYKYSNWYEEAKAAKKDDKIFLDYSSYLNVERMVKEVLSSPFTKSIFENSSFQVPLFWEEIVEGDLIPCKALPDVVQDMGDHILLTDIKTSANGIYLFEKSMLQFRYDLQASWYTYAAELLYGKPVKFQFLVMDTSENKDKPLIYKVGKKILEGGAKGFTSRKGYVYKGWLKGLSDYCWHLKNNLWDYPADVYKNRGVIELEEF